MSNEFDGTRQNQMKDNYKETKLGWIPKEWKVVTFDKVVDNRTSKYDKPTGKCIELQHIAQQTGKLLGYDSFENKESKKNHFLKDDILFCKLRPYLRKYWYCDFEGGCSSELMVFRAKKGIDSKFVYFNILQDSFIENSVSKSYGTKMPRTSWKIISEYSLRIPPLPEQQKIAKILSTIDAKLNNISDQITATQTLKKGLMQQLLTEGIGHSEFKDSKLGRIPKGWEVVKLGEIANKLTDYVAAGSFASLKENVIVDTEKNYAIYVRLVDLRKGLGHESQKYVDEKSYNFLSISNLHGREILFANIGANVGEVFLMPEIKSKATIAPNMIIIRANNKNICPEYLYYALGSPIGKTEINKIISGSGHPKINKTDLKQLKVNIPPLSEQKKIATILSKVDEKLSVLDAQRAEYGILKKGMMQVLLTGEVRVN
jgi:type I restriction enzyme S subunit